MKLDRLSLILLLGVGLTRILPVDATLANAVILSFLTRITLSLNQAALVNRRYVRVASSTQARYFSNAA